MTGHPDNQGVEPASGQDNTTLDSQTWQSWKAGHASTEEIKRWQQQRHQLLPWLPQELLDPSLFPIDLLRNPSQWSPEDSGLDPIDLLASHRDLTDSKHCCAADAWARLPWDSAAYSMIYRRCISRPTEMG